MINNWQEQIRNSPSSLEDLETYLPLSPVEKKAIRELFPQVGLPLRITPHYLSLINQNNPQDPLRLQVIPQLAELAPLTFEHLDPLGDNTHEAVPHLIHRYPD